MGIGKFLVTVFTAALLMLLEMFLCLACIPITLNFIPTLALTFLVAVKTISAYRVIVVIFGKGQRFSLSHFSNDIFEAHTHTLAPHFSLLCLYMSPRKNFKSLFFCLSLEFFFLAIFFSGALKSNVCGSTHY